VLLATLARRIGAPYPALLAVGGAVLALVPGGPRLVLDPGLALALFVAPVLLDAAYDASLRDLRDNWVPLAGLIVVAVLLTATAVAAVARALRPELSLAAALVLGAVVAPPDAAAATAVLRQVRLPHRLLVILEGESLLNDAVALLVFRLALAATANGFAPVRTVPLALASVAGSIVAGVVVARVYGRLTAPIRDVPSNIVLQFVGTFGVWMLAERVGLSGVLTIVAFAMTAARRGAQTPAAQRVPSFAVWDTVVFVLNVLAFMLIGLQLRPIFERLSRAQRSADLAFAAAVLATVIVVRFAWVMTYNTVVRWKVRRFGMSSRRPMMRPTVRGGLIISWCGMRGIVTLAAALALPERFPQRDLMVLTAFAVVLGTLLIQGLTLRPVLRLFALRGDDTLERETRLARQHAFQAALDSIGDETTLEAQALRHEYRLALERLSASTDEPLAQVPLASDPLRRRAVTAARARVVELRERAEIGDDAYHLLEEELDRFELSVGRQ
jgi:CPA1 family monovalent cation:H+ antiporter